MSRNQRDEPIKSHIADSTATNTTDQKAPVNFALVALEDAGVVKKS